VAHDVDDEGVTVPPPGGGEPTASGPAARRRGSLLAGLGAVVLGAVLAVVLLNGTGTGPSGSDVAPGIDTPAADLLQLDYLGPANEYTPANFTLTDQFGQAVSLSHLRGKVVLLSFNDDRCTDLCTLLAQDVVAADRDLGPAARRVVFLSVNVNPFYPQVRYVRQWAQDHGLGHVANWISTTGPVNVLGAIRRRYGVYLSVDARTRTVVHGTELFYIDPAGRVVAVGEYGTNAASTALYAHAMAQMAVDLLPAAERTAVGGPPVPAPTATNASVGAPGPSFSLPILGRSREHLSSTDLRGRYAVLSFWASTCTACRQEMPDVERAYRDLGRDVALVGVDVADRPDAAAAIARRLGATYPLVSDAAGTLAGAYRISGLPFTVILGPRGTVLVRHPGDLTTEQLEYVVRSEDQALGGS